GILNKKEIEINDLRIDGNVSRVVLVDQSPIGKTPRSNPATYTKVFDLIREVFAATKEAKMAGFKKGHFSFNVKGGRCETCQGQGQIRIEMQFMNDVWITCDVCKGKRYNSQILDVNFRGKNISDVLGMSVEEAIEHFHSYHLILNKFKSFNWFFLPDSWTRT
ncbi:MAG: excinuclease ABC subunit UvrA, partial [Candidatus Omnitrophica bacterium]|nr:excinuclease ABC subunit UvrA [Candidatus Omnitrophota bacterium]